jgi:hypothetical protein
VAAPRVQREFAVEPTSPDRLEAATRALEALGFEVTRSAEALAATQGSQLVTRLLGTWRVSSEPRLPKAVDVVADGPVLRFRIRETLGIGFFDQRTREKYELHFAQLEDTIRSELG